MFFKKEITWKKLLEKGQDQTIPINGVTKLIIDGHVLCVARTEKGVFALDDRCPHNGFALSKGWCSDDHAVVCPLHRYRFDLETGRSKSGISDYVRTYKTEVREDGIYVGIESTRFSLF